MKTINPEYSERVIQLANQSPYFQLISMTLKEVGIGYSTVEIDIDTKHLQPFGHVHGGVFSTIIDAATFWSVYYSLEDQDTGMTSVDLKLNYLGAVASGKLIARGRQIRLGRTLGFADAEVRDGNDHIVAHGSSTLMVLPGKGLTADPPLPSKFNA